MHDRGRSVRSASCARPGKFWLAMIPACERCHSACSDREKVSCRARRRGISCPALHRGRRRESSCAFLGMPPARGRSTQPYAMKIGVMLSPRAKHLVGRTRMQRSDERFRFAQHDTITRSRY
jgi:hypothetical protein